MACMSSVMEMTGSNIAIRMAYDTHAAECE